MLNFGLICEFKALPFQTCRINLQDLVLDNNAASFRQKPDASLGNLRGNSYRFGYLKVTKKILTLRIMTIIFFLVPEDFCIPIGDSKMFKCIRSVEATNNKLKYQFITTSFHEKTQNDFRIFTSIMTNYK